MAEAEIVSAPGTDFTAKDGGDAVDLSKSHPLQNTWTLWFDTKVNSGSHVVGVHNWGQQLKRVTDFSTVEEFWRYVTKWIWLENLPAQELVANLRPTIPLVSLQSFQSHCRADYSASEQYVPSLQKRHRAQVGGSTERRRRQAADRRAEEEGDDQRILAEYGEDCQDKLS